MVLRLEADPWACGKVSPCPKIWGTDDHSEVLVQGKVPTLEEQEQFHRPDEEAVVKYPRASMRTWAATQLAVATDLRTEVAGYRRLRNLALDSAVPLADYLAAFRRLPILATQLRPPAEAMSG
jgi:hypothetical protein